MNTAIANGARATAVRVPLLDLKAQYQTIREEISAAVERVFESQHFILGPEVAALESEIAAYTHTSHAIGMSSGTDALLAALMALEIGPGDEVITTPYSFFATAGVIARVGARPVFVDIDPHTFNMDTRALEQSITKAARVIMPVHLYGRMADMDPIIELAQKHNLIVIEDAAQAIGATDAQGRQAGSVGHIGCYSFFPSKNLGGAGDGGMAVTSDETLADKLRIVRVHGSAPKYYHRMVGGNFRLDAVQAAVLRVKLRYLDSWTAGRRRNADRYRELFAEHKLDDVVTLPTDVPGHIYNQFVIRATRRDELIQALHDAGIGTEIYYPLPLHLQECFNYLGYAAGDFPHAEAAAQETLALPIYPELSDEQLQHVVNTVAAFYGEMVGQGSVLSAS